jgi:hypothetical protein
VWRWSDLVIAIRRDVPCEESTVHRAIQRAIRTGQLTKSGATYRIAENREDVAAQTPYHRVDRLALLTLVASRRIWRHADLMDEACRRLTATETTIKRNLCQGRDHGYLNRSASRWSVTPLGRQQLAAWGSLHGIEGMRFARYITGWCQHKPPPDTTPTPFAPPDRSHRAGSSNGHPT